METVVKKFHELSADDLYSILQLRIDVFVVEQRCAYREADGLDRGALHVFLRDEKGIAAYLRVMAPGVEGPCASIGRVVSARRGLGLGKKVLLAGISAAKSVFGDGPLYLEAQVHAAPFYEKAGFRKISGEFLLDGIPHVKMLRGA